MPALLLLDKIKWSLFVFLYCLITTALTSGHLSLLNQIWALLGISGMALTIDGIVFVANLMSLEPTFD
jgi:hypothetical protein